jgi:murein L,D-transpeptidase YcbB/YkuD
MTGYVDPPAHALSCRNTSESTIGPACLMRNSTTVVHSQIWRKRFAGHAGFSHAYVDRFKPSAGRLRRVKLTLLPTAHVRRVARVAMLAAVLAMAGATETLLSPAQLAVALHALNGAETEGLPRQAVSSDSPPAEILAALLRYAKAVHSGRLEPSDFPQAWGVRPAPFDSRQGLAKALSGDQLGPWLESLPPPYAGYKGLRRGLADYRAIAANGGWPSIPAGPPLKVTGNGGRAAALRARLAVEDKGLSANGDGFDPVLRGSLMQAQRRFGLQPTGVLDAASLKALNQPVGQRILQIIANMERWRWLPDQMPPTRVQVNSGAAIVTLFQVDKPVLSMKAVAGRVGDETPMLMSTIDSVVVNPPWNVPESIANKELWPKEHRHPGYLQRAGFVVIPTQGGGKRLQQRAGDKSALGHYKFDFANPYGVYLHDTPSQGTFSRYARQASHGCVRLEKPAALAEALLAGDPLWSASAIAAAVDKGDTVRAKLPSPTPVFILYWTAFSGADGKMNFRSDPYDWDRTLLQRIGVVAGEAKAAT